MSTRSGANADALRTTNGPLARRDLAWISRAATSLPEPGGPLIMMREPVGATRSIAWRTRIMAGALPISSVSSKARCRSSMTSRRSWLASMARWIACSSRSDLNGFSMKS